MLALPPADPSLKANEICSTFSLVPDIKKQIEQVGSGYEKLKKKYGRLSKRREIDQNAILSDDEIEEEVKQKGDGQDDGSNNDNYEKKRKRRTKEDIEQEFLLQGNLYDLLGLEDVTYEASDKQIRDAYRKLALLYHPDKCNEEEQSDSHKEHWLKIGEAYEKLSDPVLKRKYDSSLPFDDTIITEADNITDENFYDKFDAVFHRNARFAKKKPVPDIGEPDTPMDIVHKFYKFWDNFDSWREFS
jgi:hypothetical protein